MYATRKRDLCVSYRRDAKWRMSGLRQMLVTVDYMKTVIRGAYYV